MTPPVILGDALRAEYEGMFLHCRVVDPKRAEEVEHTITTVLRGGRQYHAVTAATGVPWYVVGIFHALECSSNFATHLHNGDPLTARTVQVPKGRPVDGEPPFAWLDSAIDAMRYEGFDAWRDWTISGTLFVFEKYNGFGYRRRGTINSPYLWSGSQFYAAGKFVADGKFSPTAVSRQIGAAVILRRMIDQDLVNVAA
jgi:lysozyme family protein